MRGMQTEIDNLSKRLGQRGGAGELYGDSGDLEKVELEVKLKNAELRCEALQNEMDSQTVAHAQELSSLRQGILEKESMINSLIMVLVV